MPAIMMASIARRVATSSLCGMSPNGQSSNSPLPYPYRIEKVKFGAPLENVCCTHNDIPSPLLVMILKLHKEAPFKKDVFRAPGNQANMRKLIQFLQNGRLVNIENFSVHTIASVLKKFLRKLPSGIFGLQNERRLFEMFICSTDYEAKCKEMQRILYQLPTVTQHLLVLLFGTFFSIVNSRSTGMSSESLSISVAPSFFHTCIPDGNKFAKIEDVQRFKIASSIIKFMIDNFGVCNLFGKENYEYYARITRRVLNVEESWTFAFKYPSEELFYNHQEEPSSSSVELIHNQTLSPSSILTLMQQIDCKNQSPSLMLDHQIDENDGNHSNIQYFMPSSSVNKNGNRLEHLKNVNQYAESTKSLSFLPIVHERQTQRMIIRSEWFLKQKENCSNQLFPNSQRSQTLNATKVLIRKTSSKEKRAARRLSLKKEKKIESLQNVSNQGPINSSVCNDQQKNFKQNESLGSDNNDNVHLQTSIKKMTESDCTNCNVRQVNIKYSYKNKS
ncbi:Cuticle protein 16.8 [Sarcoptes scabiei]|nr:Cuticle protein 16.8 [Sarcoptes scabiei]